MTREAIAEAEAGAEAGTGKGGGVMRGTGAGNGAPRGAGRVVAEAMTIVTPDASTGGVGVRRGRRAHQGAAQTGGIGEVASAAGEGAGRRRRVVAKRRIGLGRAHLRGEARG